MSYVDLLDQWETVSELLRKAAETSDGIFVDTYGAVDHDSGHFFDHVHLTRQGNAAVAEALFKAIAASPETDGLLRRN